MEAAGPSTETQSASLSSQQFAKKSPKKYLKHARVEQDNLTHTPPTDQSTNRHNIVLSSTTPVDLSVFNFSKNVQKQTQNDPNIFKLGNNNTTSQNKPDPYHLNDPSIISVIHNPSTSTSPKNNPTHHVPSLTKPRNPQHPAEALANGLLPTKKLANIKITVHNDKRSIQTEVQQKEDPIPIQNNLSKSLTLEIHSSNQPQLQAQTSQTKPSAVNTKSLKQPQFQAQKSQSKPFAYNTQGPKQPPFQPQTSESVPREFNAQGPKLPRSQAQTTRSRHLAFATHGFNQSQFEAQKPRSQQTAQLPQKQVVDRASARLNWRAKKPYYYEEQDEEVERKVIVSGFPAYTQSQELIRKLSVIGTAQVQICKNRVAVVQFNSKAEAVAALRANDTIPMYGAILSILKYTNNDHVFQMIRQNKRVVRCDKGPPLAEPTSIDLSGHFQQQLQNLEDAIRLTPAEVEAIGPLFHDIETYLRPLYPDCQAVPFGSITTGQGIKSSDADCFLSLEPGESGQPGAGAAEHSSQFVSKAVRVLRQHKDIFTNLVSIPRANTPIIKFLHVPTKVNCDLNSKTPLGVQNSRLVGHLLCLDPRLGSAALVLKYWARIHQLSGTGRLTNYALLMLLIQYLQQSLLPPVAKLQGPQHRFIVESWDAGFDRAPLPYLRDVPPVQDLLGGFFIYYSTFNFGELVVSPLLGKALNKSDFESKCLPEEMALYSSNISSGLAYPMRTKCAMCIQDPFELSHNVASAVSGKLAADIQTHLKWAAAAYTQPEKTPGEFLRTILLSSPPKDVNCDARCGARMSLPLNLLERLEEGWRAAARTALLDLVFRDILLVPMQRRPAISREENVEIEVYVGTLTRPVWQRGWHANARLRDVHALTARHRRLTEQIVNGPEPDVHVPFEVELGFGESPRRLTVITSPMDDADLEAFRLFRMFIHNFIHRWYKTLLTPEPTPVSNGAPKAATKQQIKPATNSQDKKNSETSEKHNSPTESAMKEGELTSDDGKSSSDDGQPSSHDDGISNSSQEEMTNRLEGEVNSRGNNGELLTDSVKQIPNRKVPNYREKRKNSKPNSPAHSISERSLSAPVQIASVAYVNSQNKGVSESLAAISLDGRQMAPRYHDTT